MLSVHAAMHTVSDILIELRVEYDGRPTPTHLVSIHDHAHRYHTHQCLSEGNERNP